MDTDLSPETIAERVETAALTKMERYERVIEVTKEELPKTKRQVIDFLLKAAAIYQINRWSLDEASSEQWRLLVWVQKPPISVSETDIRNELYSLASKCGIYGGFDHGPSYQIQIIMEYTQLQPQSLAT